MMEQPTDPKTGLRVYDQNNATHLKGTLEGPKRCIKAVWPSPGWHEMQCSRPRGHGYKGLFCKQHARQYDESIRQMESLEPDPFGREH
jgi:hypothetical protein